MSFWDEDPVLKKGQTITGRWERNRYKIIRILGQGGTGQVYLARDRTGAIRAIKVSPDLVGLTHEHRIMVFLKCCEGLKDLHSVPRAFEIDEFQYGSTVYHFIVMQYCPGNALDKFNQRLNDIDAADIGLQLAVFLGHLHQAGLIFGDLKPNNVLYEKKTKKLYIVDFGSVCHKGHTIRQFTPGYDRTSWLAGTRVADERYDIFSLGIVLASLKVGKVAGKEAIGLPGLALQIQKFVRNPVLRNNILQALMQEKSCEEMVSCLYPAVKESAGHRRELKAITFSKALGIASGFVLSIALLYFY